jgi:hypothetical protein
MRERPAFLASVAKAFTAELPTPTS